jgi:hypothetical protein
LAEGLSERDLLVGIPAEKLLVAINQISPSIRKSDLTSALEKIERLQAARGITPLLTSYNRSLKLLSLTDREFLFYRRYSGETFDLNETD